MAKKIVHARHSFVAGVEKIGRENALKVGEEATVEAARMDPAPAKVQEYVKRAEDFEQKNGVKPSRQTAERWRKDVDPQRPPKERAVSEESRLRAENAQLRIENDRLRAENAKLKKELASSKARWSRSRVAHPD